jgi:hypothetical protein
VEATSAMNAKELDEEGILPSAKGPKIYMVLADFPF